MSLRTLLFSEDRYRRTSLACHWLSGRVPNMITIRPLLAFDAPHTHMHLACFLASALLAKTVYEQDNLELVLHAAGYRLLAVDGVVAEGVAAELEVWTAPGNTGDRFVCMICGCAEDR